MREPEPPVQRWTTMTNSSGKSLHQPTLHHLEQLMTGLLEGVILMDPTGVILSANPAAL